MFFKIEKIAKIGKYFAKFFLIFLLQLLTPLDDSIKLTSGDVMEKYYKYKIEKAVNVSKLVTVHYFELTKDFVHPGESHNFWELHYVDKGHLICHSGDAEHELFQGDLIFYKPMVPHRLTTDRNTAANLCVISFECNSEAATRLRNTVYKLTPYEKQLITKIFSEADKAFELPKLEPYLRKMRMKDNAPMGSLQIIQLALEELIIRLLRKDNAKNAEQTQTLFHYDDNLTNDVIQHLKTHLSEHLTLSNLAKEIGYGKTVLCTRFKSVTGKTIFGFLTELRIEEAKRLIRQGNISTAAISDALGFSEAAYFCNVFKRITGISPSEYARMIHAFDKKQQ